jgi:hypothetical protein
MGDRRHPTVENDVAGFRQRLIFSVVECVKHLSRCAASATDAQRLRSAAVLPTQRGIACRVNVDIIDARSVGVAAVMVIGVVSYDPSQRRCRRGHCECSGYPDSDRRLPKNMHHL